MMQSPPSLTLKRVAGAQTHYDDAATLRRIAVRNAREAGFSWELIARELLMTKQAAWEQFRDVDDA